MAEAGNNTGLILLGVAAVGGYLLYKKEIVPKVLVPMAVKKATRVMKVYITGVKLTKTAVQFGIRIENPNSTPMTVNALVGNTAVVMNGGQSITIGNVSKYGPITIKPAGQTDVNFDLNMDPVRLTIYFSLLLSGKVTSQAFVFTGTVNIDGNTYPVKESFRIS
jgi:LEA14-like dessication related protein